jgi:hypothetical protein
MKTSPLLSILTLALAAGMTGCATTETPPAETAAVSAAEKTLVNDFPTRDRVEYVLNCVAQHGGLTYVTQYACGCKIDKIAEKFTFSDYESAKTFSYLKSTPGESGGVFRDPAQSKALRTRLKEAEAYAEKSCFVK